MEIHLQYSSKPVIVRGIYIHPHSSLREFQDKIEQLMKQIIEAKPILNVFRDFNTHYLRDLQNFNMRFPLQTSIGIFGCYQSYYLSNQVNGESNPFFIGPHLQQ